MEVRAPSCVWSRSSGVSVGRLTGKRSSTIPGVIEMPLWLILVLVGIVLAIIGFGGAGSLLIWIGVILLVVGLIGTLVTRGSRV